MERLHRILGLVAALAIFVAAASWATMWFTESAIFVPRACAEYASIELKGKTFRTCAYLATRYRAGDYGWSVSMLIILLYVLVDRAVTRAKKRF